MCILYVELYDQIGHFNVCKPMTKCGTPYTIHESISYCRPVMKHCLVTQT